jgi:hypothetical protein
MIHPKTNSYESRFQLTSWRIKLDSTPAGTGNCTGISHSTTFPAIDIGIGFYAIFIYHRLRLKAERLTFSAIEKAADFSSDNYFHQQYIPSTTDVTTIVNVRKLLHSHD